MGYGMDRGVVADTPEQQAFPFSNVLVGGAPQALNVPVDDIPAKATTEVNALLNLDARAVNGQDLNTLEVKENDEATEAEVDVNYHFSNNFTAYDSLGNAINVATYFERVGENSNQWNVVAVTDGVYRGAFTLDFTQSGRLRTNADGVVTGIGESANPAGGAVVTPDDDTGETRVSIAGIPGGVDAEDLILEFKFDGTTQFAADSLQEELNQDGFTSGALAGITVTETGVIQRNFTNGETRAAGQIALASFRNEEGLQPLGNNLWAATNTSGLENLGAPGTGRLGQIGTRKR